MTQQALVRYVSPFGSPAWMTRERARRWLATDNRLWDLLERAEREGAGPLRAGLQPPEIQFGRRS